MANQDELLAQLAKMVFEVARDVAYLLDHHPETVPGPMGGGVYRPTAAERANEIRITLHETQTLFGVNPQPHQGEAK